LIWRAGPGAACPSDFLLRLDYMIDAEGDDLIL
jgi:hypothetical protein